MRHEQPVACSRWAGQRGGQRCTQARLWSHSSRNILLSLGLLFMRFNSQAAALPSQARSCCNCCNQQHPSRLAPSAPILQATMLSMLPPPSLREPSSCNCYLKTFYMAQNPK
jgi:hypothetical protein